MSLTPGTRLGPYEVTALIGEGGMGKVWRAHHTGLKRDDALKVLPDAFASDPDRLARFRREAQVLASLNHPNIAHVYGLERSDGVQALVMELVEGPTLAGRIAQGPMPVDEALPIARQIAEALEAAHEQGIIHRDLKPANIKLRPDGTVKVLDFGLAKALEPVSGTHIDATASPTITSPVMMTGVGVLLGTAAYMSPEQAKGRAVDRRADVWAFGCVLFEMVSGRQPFARQTVSETLAEVMKSEPPWDALPAGMPPRIVTVLRRCLDKDPRRRVRDIGDVRLALDGAFDTPPGSDTVRSTPASGRQAWARPLVVGGTAVFVGGLVASLTMWTLIRATPESRQVIRLTAAPAGGERIGSQFVNDPDIAISPDGRRIVYAGGGSQAQLYVRELDQLQARPLQGLGTGPRMPFISPDGLWIGFIDGATGLRKVSVNGGPPITLCPLGGYQPRGASWGLDNTIVFATAESDTGLLRVSASGGQPEVLTKADREKGELDHVYPEVLPGGRAVLFTIVTGSAIDNAQIAALNLQTRQQKILLRGGSNPHFAESGHLVYGVAGTLRAVAFDPERLEVLSDPVPVLERVVTKSNGAANFAISRNGLLVYLAGDPDVGAQRRLAWLDRDGREETIAAPPRAYTYPRLSPDGTRVAISVRDQDQDVWVWDFRTQTLSRLTVDPSDDTYAMWTPDGRRIVFTASSDGAQNLYWRAADGTGEIERLTETPNQQFAHTFSADGTRLVFRQNNPNTGTDLYVLSTDGARQARALLQTQFTEINAEISPDGRWLAYQSNDSGQDEVNVRPFPDVNGGRSQISRTGGSRPLWARSGRELFYVTAAGALMRVQVDGGTGFATGSPSQVLDASSFIVGTGGQGGGESGRNYDVSPDGRRFLVIKESRTQGNAQPAQLVVVQHWLEELKRLVPTN